MRGRLGEDDSDDEHPPAALTRSSSEATTDPPPAHDGAGKVTSHSVPPALNDQEGPEVHMAEVDPLAVEWEAEDQGVEPSRTEEIWSPNAPLSRF